MSISLSPPPVGELGWVAGRKGPSKPSPLAFLQNLQAPCGPSRAKGGVVRGVLPLELRGMEAKLQHTKLARKEFCFSSVAFYIKLN